MTRILSLEIKSCNGCPFKVFDDGDGESPWTFYFCSKKGRDNGYLNNMSAIPGWCPLPKQPKKVKAQIIQGNQINVF